MLYLQPPQPRLLLQALQLRLGLLGQGKEEGTVSAQRGIGFSALVEPFARVLPNRLEHPVAYWAILGDLGHNKRLVYQSREQVEDILLLDAVGSDLLSGLQRP